MTMETLAVTLVAVLPFIPSIIIDFTNGLKPHVRSSVIFLLPYCLGVIMFGLLFFVFGELPIELYLLNGVLFGYGASKAYDATKKSVLNDQYSLDYNDYDLDLIEPYELGDEVPNNEV